MTYNVFGGTLNLAQSQSIIAKLYRVRNWQDWGPNYSMANFSCFHEIYCTWNSWHVCSELLF